MSSSLAATSFCLFPGSARHCGFWPVLGELSFAPGRNSTPDSVAWWARRASGGGRIARIEHRVDRAEACLYVDTTPGRVVRLRYRLTTAHGRVGADCRLRIGDAESCFLACALSLTRELGALDAASAVDALERAARLERLCRGSLRLLTHAGDARRPARGR